MKKATVAHFIKNANPFRLQPYLEQWSEIINLDYIHFDEDKGGSDNAYNLNANDTYDNYMKKSRERQSQYLRFRYKVRYSARW